MLFSPSTILPEKAANSNHFFQKSGKISTKKFDFYLRKVPVGSGSR
jgi:hypothetical protein